MGEAHNPAPDRPSTCSFMCTHTRSRCVCSPRDPHPPPGSPRVCTSGWLGFLDRLPLFQHDPLLSVRLRFSPPVLASPETGFRLRASVVRVRPSTIAVYVLALPPARSLAPSPSPRRRHRRRRSPLLRAVRGDVDVTLTLRPRKGTELRACFVLMDCRSIAVAKEKMRGAAAAGALLTRLAAGDVDDFFVFVCARATTWWTATPPPRPSSPGSQPRQTAKEGDAGARIKSSSSSPTVCRAGTCCHQGRRWCDPMEFMVSPNLKVNRF